MYNKLGTTVGTFSVVFLCVVSAALIVLLIFWAVTFVFDQFMRKGHNKNELAGLMLEMFKELEKSEYMQRAFERRVEQKLELLGNAQVKTYKETANALEIVAKRLETAKPTDDISKIKMGINADFISLNRKLDAFLDKRKQNEEATLNILQKLKTIVGDTTLEDIDKMHRTAAKHEYDRIIGAIQEYISGPYPGLKEGF